MDLLLPVCISLAALALVVAIVLWLRGRRGRAAQAFGLAALPVGLYLTGLLGLVLDAAAALGRWAAQLVFNPAVWAGASLLGLAVVLWVVGGLVAKRTRSQRAAGKATLNRDSGAKGKPTSPRAVGKSAPTAAVGTSAPTAAGGRGKGAAQGGAPADNDFDEIEELLRRRGIE